MTIKVGDRLPAGTVQEFIEVEGNGCSIGPNTFKVEDLEKMIGTAIEEAEEKTLAKKHLWLELCAVAFRLWTHNCECVSCAFAQDIQDRCGTISVIGEDEVTKFKEMPGSQRLCRYASVHFVKKDQSS